MNANFRLMKTSAVGIALIALLVGGAMWEVRRVRAVAAPDLERGLFGMVGITRGQTLRVNVVNLVNVPDGQIPPPCRVVLSFRNAQGQPFSNSEGQPIRRVVELQAGESAFLDLNGDQLGGIDTNAPGRVQLRPFVRVLQSPSDPDGQIPPCRATGEVFDNATLRTSFVLPGVERMGGPEGHNHNETLVRDLQSRER